MKKIILILVISFSAIVSFAKQISNPVPVNVCVGVNTTISDGTKGGTWISNNTDMATIAPTTGTVTGIQAGILNVIHIAGADTTTTNVTVNPLPPGIAGQLNICTDISTTLNDAAGTAGAWSSNSTSITIDGSTGVVAKSASAGSAVITYLLSSTRCLTTATINVYSIPPAITGDTQTNINGHIGLSDAVANGTWSSSNSAVVVIAPAGSSGSGSSIMLFGVSAGTAVITYSACNGSVTRIVKVDSTKKIAQNKLQIFAAIYTTPPAIKSDDAKLTQIYVRFSVPIRKAYGIDNDANICRRWIPFRNLYTQLTYATNANNTNYIDSTSFRTNKLLSRTNYSYPILDSPFSARHVNRLDLLENANFNLNMSLPFLTYIVPLYKTHKNNKKIYKGDFAHIYFEPFCSLLSTTISREGDSANNLTVYSVQPGFDIGMRTEHMLFDGAPIFLELTSKIFWIIPLSNSVNPDLNYQYARINDYNTSIPGKHLLDPSNHPYYNFDALILYNTNKSNSDGSSNVFVHFNFITNIVKNSGHVYNNFMQIQLGYALNIQTFISQIQAKAVATVASGPDDQ